MRSQVSAKLTSLAGSVTNVPSAVLFVYVPQVEEYGSPVKHVHWHVLRALFDAPPGHRPYLHGLLARLCQPSFRRFFDFLPHTVKQQHQALRDRLDRRPETVLDIVSEAKEIAPYLALADSIASRLANLPSEIVRALALAWSPRTTQAWSWLRGDSLDETVLAELKLPEDTPNTSSLLRVLAGVLKRLQMVLVIGCDQSEQLLERPSELRELTTALMGWLDAIPNVVLSLTFLKDRWESFDKVYHSFVQRSHILDLESLTGPQAVDLIRRRLAGWPGGRPDKSPLWPFREDDILSFAAKAPVSARGLFKALSRSTRPLAREALGRGNRDQRWRGEEAARRTLPSGVGGHAGRGTQGAVGPGKPPGRATLPCHGRGDPVRAPGRDTHWWPRSVAGSAGRPGEPEQVQVSAAQALRKGNDAAIPVVVAASNLAGGVAMTGFLKALDQAVADPVAGAVLVRPSAQLTLGPKTEARKKYEALISCGKLRPFALTDHRPAFEQMECYLRLLDRRRTRIFNSAPKR